MEFLLDGHARAFEHFGGRTAKILYDNPRTIVLSKDESGWVEWNATFKDRMDFYGVEIQLCRYYRARTKGKVESGSSTSNATPWPAGGFGIWTRLNAGLLAWCLTSYAPAHSNEPVAPRQ